MRVMETSDCEKMSATQSIRALNNRGEDVQRKLAALRLGV